MGTARTVYEQFDKATQSLGAYAILDDQRRYVGRIVFRYPRDGAGRLRCFAQVWGAPMQVGHAGGYGYDKATAAFEAAAARLETDPDSSGDATVRVWLAIIRQAAAEDSGWSWSQRLERRGFAILNITG